MICGKGAGGIREPCPIENEVWRLTVSSHGNVRGRFTGSVRRRPGFPPLGQFEWRRPIRLRGRDIGLAGADQNLNQALNGKPVFLSLRLVLGHLWRPRLKIPSEKPWFRDPSRCTLPTCGRLATFVGPSFCQVAKSRGRQSRGSKRNAVRLTAQITNREIQWLYFEKWSLTSSWLHMLHPLSGILGGQLGVRKK